MSRQGTYTIPFLMIFLWVMGACTPHTKALTSTPLPTSPSVLSGKDASADVYTINPADGGDTVGVFRPSQGTFYLKNTNTSGFADIAVNYGLAGDYPVMGDWNGDGTDTIGVYRDGNFLLRNSNTIGIADIVFAFGAPGDQPISGDWDGDGVDTIGVYHNGNFSLRNSNASGEPEMNFVLGNPGDIGIAGDWNGDGVDTVGVFRPSSDTFYLKNTNATGFADIQINYGLSGDIPVTGDWNNDGTDTIGVYRNGTFYLRNSNTIAFTDIVFALGVPGDMPIAGTIFTPLTQGPIYYVSPAGDDSNAGTQTGPWRTIQKAANTVVAGDLVYIRGGEYSTEGDSPTFRNSGTEANPITLRNYPGEQVVIRLKGNPAFFCWWKSTTQGPMVSYVKILGTDVSTRTLSNGVNSQKGIVIQGIEGEQVSGITAHGCDYWEVGGVDFVDVASGIFSAKQNNRQNVDNSADYWYVHDSRVYGFYRESGMQFNTDDNRIENNEIYKVTDRVDTPYGCQLLNVLGDHNVVQGNVLSRKGSTAACSGIMLEWDLADMNMVEQNRILDVTSGITIEGGDDNLFRNNVIATNESYTTHKSGIEIVSYDNRSSWPCNEETGSAQVLLPPDDPSHPDYQYYYNPRNCHSTGNQIYNNTIYGFEEGISLYELVGENTIIRNNVMGNWMQEAICFHDPSQRQCYPLPLPGLLADHNVVQEPFGFMEAETLDFYLSANSPLIDAGLNLGSLNPNDFDGNPRPQGTDYDIGAYEYLFGTQP